VAAVPYLDAVKLVYTPNDNTRIVKLEAGARRGRRHPLQPARVGRQAAEHHVQDDPAARDHVDR
jgi:hypothetical protein